MFAPIFAAIFCLCPAIVQAQCVVAKDLSAGVTFARQDGHRGDAALVQDLLQIDYAADSVGYIDNRTTAIGIYEISWSWLPITNEVTKQRRDYSYEFSGQPPLPEPGITWKSELSVTEMPAVGPPHVYTLSATYSFQNPRRSTISGCSYPVIPVEARFVGNGIDYTRRWNYFTELGIGLEARFTDNLTGATRGLGLTDLTAVR